MTEFGDWLQNNAIDLARLAIECVILVTMVKFSRTLLRTLRASQEQLGALLRLSVSEGGERSAAAPDSQRPVFASRESEPALIAEREPAFAPMAPAPAYSSGILGPINGGNRGGNAGANGSGNGGFNAPASREREQNLGGRVTSEPPGWSLPDSSVAVAEAPAPTPWVAAPMASAPEGNAGGGVMQWLNSPMPKRTKKRGNPLRKALRWLQTPAGS
jgi:hypothetical protein